MKKILIMIGLILSLGVTATAYSADKNIFNNPNSLRNSEQWYAAPLRKSFKTFVRACSTETPSNKVSIYTDDITKFRVSRRVSSVNNLQTVKISGTVGIGPLSAPYAVPTVKGSKDRSYLLYVEAYLYGPDGKVYDIQSTTIKGAGSLSPKGGKVGFSVDIGKGYDFSRGGRVLLIAGGDSIVSDYPMDTCVLFGGKWVSVR
ncbi:MAG: hypothetical protein IME99_02125 [Proteobacteria bacterium]|nr:hypothetical protein [Pseudomonadota bacterium]